MKKLAKRIITCLLTAVLCYSFGPFFTTAQEIVVETKADSVSNGYVSEVQDGGIYYIKNQRSNLYLDVDNNSTSSGTALLQYSYKGYPNQQFKLTKYSDSGGIFYTFTPMNCAYLDAVKVVEVKGNSSANDVSIQTGNYTGSANQKFKITPTGNNDNSFVIKTGSSSYSKCITVSGASKDPKAKIIQYSYYNHGTDDNDHWYFEELPIFNGTYYVKNQKSGKYLDVQGNSTETGTKLIQYKYNGSTNQQFKIVPHSQGGYTFTPVVCDVEYANTAVEIKDGTLTNRTAIQLGTKNFTNPKQRFNIIPTGNGEGAFKIMAFGDADNLKGLAVSGASTSDSAEIVLYDYGNNGTNDNDHWYFEDITPLNQKKLVNLKNYSQKVIEFVCPDNKLYTVETFKYGSQNSDPVIAVSGLTSGYYQDDNGGEGNQAKISFHGEKGKLIEVFIWGKTTESKSCYIQLRKQKAALFGGEYGDIDTTSDLSVPASELAGLYDCHKYYDYSSNFTGIDERNLKAFNSEIMFFSGHGNINFAKFVEGEIYTSNLNDMSYVKVAVWSSCYSSLPDGTGTSLVTGSVAAGAKSALGFNKSIPEFDARKFTNKFFEELADGKTVASAAQSAKSQFLFPVSIKDYVIAGDGNTVVTTPDGIQTANYTLSSYNNATAYDNSLLTHFLSVCEYDTELLGENQIRYYKKINGCLSSQYIDVSNGNIISTNYCPENDEKPVLPALIDTSAPPSENEVINRLKLLREDSSALVDSYRIYYFDGNAFVPVELNYITYLDETRYQDCICINLHTGEEIAYESFAYLEN